MNMNTSLRVAMAMLIGTATQGAIAASPTDPIKIASETGTFSSQALSGVAAFDIPVINNKMISSTAPYYVIITLTGGAQFGSPTGLELTCGYSGTGTITTTSASAAAVTAETDSPAAVNGGTIAAFKLQSANGGGVMTGNCKLSFNATTSLILTSGVKDYGVSITRRHLDPADTVTSTVAGNIVTFTQGVQVSVSAGTVTVDVTSPSLSKKFLVTGSVMVTGTTTAVANLGVIRYSQVPNVVDVSGAAAAPATYVNNFTLIVSGTPIAAAQSTAAAGVVSGGIYLVQGATCLTAGTAIVGATLKYASGNQVSFDALLTTDVFTAGTAAFSVCMVGNDVSTIDRGTVSFSIGSISPVSPSVPNMTTVDTTLVKVEKNGTSIKVLNIPAPENGTDQAYIRLYNMGANAGKIFGTLYSQDVGTVLGSANVMLVDGLVPNGVTVLNAAQLATKFGVATWPGRAWLQIESEVKGLRVQALIRSNGTGGVLMNVSDRIMVDGETLQRTE